METLLSRWESELLLVLGARPDSVPSCVRGIRSWRSGNASAASGRVQEAAAPAPALLGAGAGSLLCAAALLWWCWSRRPKATAAVLPKSCWVATTASPPFIILEASPTWHALWGFSARESVGRSISILNAGRQFDRGASSEVMWRFFECGDATPMRCQNVAKDGSAYSHDLSLGWGLFGGADCLVGTSLHIRPARRSSFRSDDMRRRKARVSWHESM